MQNMVNQVLLTVAIENKSNTKIDTYYKNNEHNCYKSRETVHVSPLEILPCVCMP